MAPTSSFRTWPRWRWHRGRRVRRRHRRQASGPPDSPQAVRHQHRRGDQRGQGPAPGAPAPAAGRLPAPDRPGPVRVHRGGGLDRPGAPRGGGLPGRPGGAPLPPQLAVHGHRGHRHPGLHREHIRAHVGDGLHAEHHHPAGADPGRRHRHRRRDRGPREHLPVHGGEGAVPAPGRRGGTREIGLAVLATTLSLVAVFLPVAFMGGIVGRFMNSFGLTMAFSILVSLFVAYTLTPMMASRWLSIDEKAARTSKESRVFGWIERGYGRALSWSMARRWIIVLACVAALASVVPLFIFG